MYYIRDEDIFDKFMKTLAERLKEIREKRELTQEALAKLVPCSQGTIGNLESGTRLESQKIVAIARALGVNPDWLQYGTPPQEPLLALSPKEVFIVQSYRSTTQKGRETIEMVCLGVPKTDV